MIEIDQNICGDLEAAQTREWLETNGLGGFASSTIIGLNTRRYHGLLTAATKPPVGRMVLLSKFEEALIIDGKRYDLSANQYPGTVHPQGFQLQTGFRLDPFPIFTYEVEGIEMEKSVFMVQGENTTVVEYQFRLPEPAANSPLLTAHLSFEIRPLIAFRDYHSTTHENSALNSRVEIEVGRASVAPYADLPTLYFAHDSGEIETHGDWYRNFEYRVEQERGLDSHEDLFSPFAVTFAIDQTALATKSGTRVSIITSTDRRDAKQAKAYREAEVARRQTITQSAPHDNDLVRAATLAADQYIVAHAGETLEYNTVDATLWFFEAVRALVYGTKDFDFVRDNLYEVLRDIIDWHVRGTRYSIHVDTDGLLFSGEQGVQLTWMDAKVGDWVVTPRTGKAVEIQALWYNALRVMEDLAEKFGDKANEKQYKTMAAGARKSFNELFWNEQTGCLYDVVNGDERDASIRPNQVLAISLTNSLVSRARAKNILRVVERELLTPRGLRTLSPNDSRYVGRYEGDTRSRDGAYHQGTVWPWLMGSYITAYVKTFGQKAGRKFATEWLNNFEDHLTEACLCQVSEIFDGDSPHTPRGCVAQAWSVGELLRASLERVDMAIPAARAATMSMK